MVEPPDGPVRVPKAGESRTERGVCVCSLAQALESPLCVAGEARVDAPLLAAPQASWQVSVRTTPSGWRARNGACPRKVLRIPSNVQRLPAAGGPGVECGVTTLPLSLKFFLQTCHLLHPGALGRMLGTTCCPPGCTFIHPLNSLQEWAVPRNQLRCDCS